jgi:hypothetical protein
MDMMPLRNELGNNELSNEDIRVDGGRHFPGREDALLLVMGSGGLKSRPCRTPAKRECDTA